MKVTLFKGLPYSKQEVNPHNHTSYHQTYTYPATPIEVEHVFEIIGSGYYQQQIDQLRSLYKVDKQQYAEVKKSLPICIFSGEYTGFGNNFLTKPSGLICLDFDKVPTINLVMLKYQLMNDPFTYALFISPSGTGFKVIVKLQDNTDEVSHRAYFAALKEHYDSPYFDDACKDMTRACFLSSDPDIYINSQSRVWGRKVFTSETTTNPLFSTASTFTPPALSCMEVEKYIRFLEGGWKKYPMANGSRHDSVFNRSRELAEWGIDMEDAIAYFSVYADAGFGIDEINREIIRAYEKVSLSNRIGVKYRAL